IATIDSISRKAGGWRGWRFIFVVDFVAGDTVSYGCEVRQLTMAKLAIDNAQWLSELSEPLKNDIMDIMTQANPSEGDCLLKEGEIIDRFIIVEAGTLIRTKSTEEADGAPLPLDELGAGKVTGFLHVLGHHNDDKAFANVVAGKDVKVWIVRGAEFQTITENPKHANELLNMLTRLLRKTSKIVRATLRSPDIRADGASREETRRTIKIMCYDTTSWVREKFEPQVQKFNNEGTDFKLQMDYTSDRLEMKTAKYAAGYDAVCLFVNDTADTDTLWVLSMGGVKLIAMRCAGFDRVDTKAAKAFGLTVTRVPAYSPYAVAEHAISLLMAVNRKTHIASVRVKMSNFSLDSGLLGMDIHGKTVAVMGTGKIGQILCKIISGFGVNLLAYDVFENDEVKSLGGKYVSKEEIYKQSDIIFLMMPLLQATRHTINEDVLPMLKKGVIIINTSRGGLIDTNALISGLHSGIIGGCGLDVYENEGEYFFQDYSSKSIKDERLIAMLGNNRIVLTAHQAFFTKEAIDKIVSTTIENLTNFASGLRGNELPNSVC
ncbi:hypothetical protein ACHAWT_006479, partial [Skeletonema menzelii]